MSAPSIPSDFTPHLGGECPIPRRFANMLFRNGKMVEASGPARFTCDVWRWTHFSPPHEYDVIAYKEVP